MKQKVIKLSFSLIFVICAMPVLAAEGGEHHFDIVEFIARIVNFTIFFGGLFYLLGGAIKKFFGDRVKTIRESLEIAEKSREEAKRRLDEIEEKMSKLDEELAEIEAQAKHEAEQEREKIHAQAEQEAARILEQANAEIENMRREALLDLKAFIAELAVDEAQRMISETVTDQDRARLFAEFSERLGAKS